MVGLCEDRVHTLLALRHISHPPPHDSDDLMMARNRTFLQSMLPDCPIPCALFKELVYDDIQYQQLKQPTSRLVGMCI